MSDENGWIEWGGGECPVPLENVVDIRTRNGAHDEGFTAKFWAAGAFDWWKHESTDHDLDIIAYRVVQS